MGDVSLLRDAVRFLEEKCCESSNIGFYFRGHITLGCWRKFIMKFKLQTLIVYFEVGMLAI